MKLVLISDTHGLHRKLTDIPEGDVLIHAGDFTNYGEAREVYDFNQWIGDHPHPHKVVIAGNHEMNWTDEKRRMLTNVTYLEDSRTEIDGLTVWGSPFTPKFGGWAFMLPRGKTLMEKWLTIPHTTDVLITHGPPKGVLDTATPGGENLGDSDLDIVVSAIAPRLHVFGHIHGGHGYRKRGETTYVNAAICNEAYYPINQPFVLEL